MDTHKSSALLRNFFETGKISSFKRRDFIVRYGDKPTHAHYLTKGVVKVISTMANGDERIHYLYGPGEVFPLSWLFGPRPHDISVIAFTDCTVRLQPVRDFAVFVDKEPYSLVSILEQQNLAFGRIINLNMGSAEQRVAYRLITLGQRFGQTDGDACKINMPVTIQELADMVRLTRETTGKVLADLEAQGRILFCRQHIVVYPDKLKPLAEVSF